METHHHDPKPGEDPWDSVSSELRDLGQRLRDTYRQVADERGPSEDEIKGAFATLAGAWGQIFESVGGAMRDPEVRDHLKQAASAFATAIGTTLSELGSELRPDHAEEE